jgi:hypothetical protein
MKKIIILFITTLLIFTLQSAPTKSNIKTETSDANKIETQCFDTELEGFGKVKFESHHINEKLYFYLSKNGKRFYEFPSHEYTWTLEEVLAVSFQDINGDKKKDVLVIANYITGMGKDGVVPFAVASVFLNAETKFIYSKKNDKLNTDMNAKHADFTIQNIKKYFPKN